MQIWQRKCPMCFKKIEKDTLQEPWACECGWTTDEKRRRIVEEKP